MSNAAENHDLLDNEVEDTGTPPDTDQTDTQDATTTEDAGTADKEAAQPDTVPAAHYHNLQAAMRRERHLRQELEKSVKTMEDRFGKILESVKAPPTTETKSVDYDDDPMAYIRNQTEQTAKSVKEMQEKIAGQGQSEQLRKQEAALIMQVAELAEDFTKANPDYPKAFNFYRDHRLTALQQSGLDKQEATAQLEGELRELSQYALKYGLNPAEQIYGYAKTKGYEKPVPANKNSKDNEDDVTKSNEGKEKLENLEKNMQQSKSVGSGAAPSLGDLANMSDDEFELAMKEMGFKT